MTRTELLEAVAEAARKLAFEAEFCARMIPNAGDLKSAATNARKALAAMDAAPAEAANDGWRPIDDIARDGEDWLLCSRDDRRGIRVVAFWDDGRWQTADGPGYHPDLFAYYRPLPPPPAPREGDDS